MALHWEDEPRETVPHRGVDPVSAWLVRRADILAGPGGRGAGAPRHVGIVDFQPRRRDPNSGRIVITGLHGAGYAGLGDDAIESVIGTGMANPRVFLLPLHRRSLASDAAGSVARTVGAPAATDVWLGPEADAIVGTIDHAINVFHHRFRLPDASSRVTYAWMQGGDFNPDDPEAVPFGREWTRDTIGAALARHGQDEDSLLRLLDADFSRPGLRPLALRESHGTHVLDLAAGMGPDDPQASRLPLIAVNLPPEAVRETTGSVLGLFFLQGLIYILSRSRTIMRQTGRPLPVYVNISLGLTGGMRRGRHPLERAIVRTIADHRESVGEEFGSSRPVEVFVPAGNRNLARGHAASEGSQTLATTWQIQPADPSANHVMVRIETEETDVRPELTLALVPPGRDPVMTRFDSVPQVDSMLQARLLKMDGAELGRAALRSEGSSQGTHLFELSIALAPTDPGMSGFAALPPGGWGLTLTVARVATRRIDAWILRDDTPPGFHGAGRQSRFSDPAYRARDMRGRLLGVDPEDTEATVRRAGTLNALATGGSVTVVGGLFTRTAEGPAERAPRAVPYSGIPLPGGGERVDISAPSERSPLLPGVLAAGTRSGSRVAINGTSVAAPQALRLRWLHGTAGARSEARSRQLGATIVPGDRHEGTGQS